MYGFLLRPRWLAFHLLVVSAIVVMILLGFWQLRRLDERKDFNQIVEARIDAPAVSITQLLAEPGAEPEDVEWRPVSATGAYLPDQILVFNRTQNGRAGDNVLTPLQLEGGSVVLVNRGFVPLGVDTPSAPSGTVEVLGLARRSQHRERGGLTDAGDGPITEIRRVEIERLAPQLPGEVEPIYIDLISSQPGLGPDDPEPLPRPALGSGPHLPYAVQWFIFSFAVAAGWVLAVRRSIARRRSTSVTDGADPPATAGSLTPAGGASTSSTSGTVRSSSG